MTFISCACISAYAYTYEFDARGETGEKLPWWPQERRTENRLAGQPKLAKILIEVAQYRRFWIVNMREAIVNMSFRRDDRYVDIL
jgi:hypothetical protein